MLVSLGLVLWLLVPVDSAAAAHPRMGDHTNRWETEVRGDCIEYEWNWGHGIVCAEYEYVWVPDTPTGCRVTWPTANCGHSAGPGQRFAGHSTQWDPPTHLTEPSTISGEFQSGWYWVLVEAVDENGDPILVDEDGVPVEPGEDGAAVLFTDLVWVTELAIVGR